MHILNMLVIVDNYDTEYIHNIIENIFEVVLKDAPVIPPHHLYQLEPKLLLKVYELV